MMKLVTKTLPFFFIFISSMVFGQKVSQVEVLHSSPEIYKNGDLVVCYAGGEIIKSIPVSKEFRERIKARTNTATFEVVYVGFDNFPEAKDAFQFAVDIWSTLIESPVTIRVSAQFSPLDQGVLGSAAPSRFIRNFDNTPRFNTWFPVALVEKISNQQFNGPNDFEIEANFSSTAGWYYDTSDPEGIAGTGLTDFASVVLHELGHGLGFLGVANVTDAGVGSIGLSGFPMTYTTFAENGSGDNLVNDIQNDSQLMGDALTSGSLRFDGTTQDAALFAPSEFNGGSSFSHLDDAIYTGTPNELMTPTIGSNGFIHDPGIALDIMYDFGWEFTYINHNPVANTEVFDQSFDIVAKVTSDVGYDTSSLNLRYSTDGFSISDTSILMQPSGNRDEFVATIPNPGAETTFSYYIEVLDAKQRMFTDPGQAPDIAFYQFRAALDDSIPTIEHTPIDFVLNTKTEETVSASIFDFFMGVDTAYVEYSINNVSQTSFGMTRDPETFTIFDGTMDLSGGIKTGDKISYRIVAIDSAQVANQAFDPATGFHEFFVEETSEPISSYENDFNTTSTDFLGDGFLIRTPANFTDAAIHSLHPYEEAGLENEINYLYQLKFPIIVDEVNTMVQFDEIVLVEPGEDGTGFGSQDFFDFVATEVSLNKGQTWFAATNGYDSRDEGVWLVKYNSSTEGNNSTAVGDETLYITRSFDLLENPSINAGDTLLFRFRLFSDPFAAGWGWAIDNLTIQKEIVASVEDYLESDDELSISPNPSQNGVFNFNARFKKQPKKIQLTVLDLMGKVIYTEIPLVNSLILNHEINLGNQPAGIYFVTLLLDNDRVVRKVLKSR